MNLPLAELARVSAHLETLAACGDFTGFRAALERRAAVIQVVVARIPTLSRAEQQVCLAALQNARHAGVAAERRLVAHRHEVLEARAALAAERRLHDRLAEQLAPPRPRTLLEA